MLTISKPLNASQARSYHALEFTAATQSYYQKGCVAIGEWQGQLAERFGLEGAVTAEQFARLAEGQHPQTGAQLVKHRVAMEYATSDGDTARSVEHRAGWDATFSAPKSVSLTALVGGDDRVREAHRFAVITALAELERYTQARIGGNHAAETTGKFLAAKFEHDTARPVDGYAAPQLHTHAVIFNLTERDNGKARAIQPQGYFQSQSFATAVYQAELTVQLRRLGYEIEAGKSGAPEIKGYSREYLDASSPRSQQIKTHLEMSGRTGAASAQIAAHATRDGKQILTPAEVLASHRALAAEHGNQAGRVVAEARGRARIQAHEPDGIAAARQAVSYARASNYEREAVVDERKLMRDALRRGMGEASYGQVRSEFKRRAEQGHFREIRGSKHATGRSFTTPETIAQERANVAHMLKGRDSFEPVTSSERAKEQTAACPHLTEAQRAVIEAVLTNRDKVQGIQGLAGTGKTTAVAAIREAAERNGYAVEGFAPTARAAAQLRDAGVSATTLQSFVARGAQRQFSNDPSRRHLYILDESSLASTQQMKAFLDKIQPQDRVLLIGDTGQHQGVEAGKPFQQLQDGGLRTAQLDQIIRQQNPELRKAVELLAKGDAGAGVRLLSQQGRVTEVANPQQRYTAIAKAYAAKAGDTIIISPDNRSRQEINQAVRSELRSKGLIATESQRFETLSPRSDITGADRAWAVRYQPGNVIQYTTGSKELGIERGSSAKILSTNPKENTLTVEHGDGQAVTYNPQRLRGVNVFETTEREFSIGDRLQFTAPSKDLGVVRRELGTITELREASMTVRMDGKGGLTVSFNPRDFRSIDHGYVLTSHSAQGLTSGRTLINIDVDGPHELVNQRLAYVAVSRAVHEVHIFTNHADRLAACLSQDNSKTSAVEFWPPAQTRNSDELTRVHNQSGMERTHPTQRQPSPGFSRALGF